MGAAESVIRNADKRTSRRENRETFAEGIEAFRAGWADPSERLGPDGRASPRPQDEEQVVRVCVRKRPMFEREVRQGEFDVVSCARSQLVIHDARMGPDMKARFLDNNVFSFNEVFSEHDSSDKVFDTVVAPLVTIVRKGGNGTALMYGQTGSGKTFTMTNAYKRASEAFFKDQPDLPSLSQVFVSFVELAGDSVHDVLNKHAKLQLLSCPNGNVLAYPGVQVPVTSAEELHSCITFACSLRATAATGVHDQSSRSHALCRIELPNGNALTLVDLAGSEHRIDSAEHDAQRRKEGAQINSSLMKLKECVRARAQNASYIPYRQSKLTHLLRPAFVEDTGTVSRTIIIATVSPSSKDTEHSLNTVRHACIMDGQEQDSKETRWITGGKTSRQHLAPVNVTMLAKKKKAQRDALRKGKGGKPGHGEGGGWGAAPPPQHSRDGSFDSTARKAALKKQNAEVERARRQAEVASVKLLPNHMRALLKQARESAGELQRARVNELQQHVRAAEARAANEARAAERKKKTKPERRPLSKPVVQEAQHEPVRGNSPNARQVCTLTPPHVDMAAPTKLHQEANSGRQEPCVDTPEVVTSPEQPSPRRTMTWDEMRQDIRERVWADPRVPDDMKEEQIVDICRALKARLGLGSDATNNGARTPSNSGDTMQSFGQPRAGGAESSPQIPEDTLGSAGGAAIDSTSHWEKPVDVGHESPNPFPGSRSEEESRSYNPERYEPDRHEKARRAREELIDAKKRKAEAKLSAKMNKSSVDTLGAQTLEDLKQHLALREADFQRETDSMKRFGLKKQVEKARAAVIRLERKQKQAQADASRGLQPQQALEPSPRGAVEEPCVT